MLKIIWDSSAPGCVPTFALIKEIHSMNSHEIFVVTEKRI